MATLRALARATALLVAVASLAHAQGKTDLTVPIDRKVLAQFKILDAHAGQDRWDKVIAGLDTMLAQGGGTLVLRGGRTISLRDLVRERLRALGPDGRRAYEVAHGTSARRLLDSALLRYSVETHTDPLEELIALHPGSHLVPQARELLAGRYAEQGEPGLAIGHLDGLLSQEGLTSRARRRLTQMRGWLASLASRPAPPQAPQDDFRLAWRHPASGYYENRRDQPFPWTWPRCAGGLLYAHDGSHAVAVDLRTGRVVWRTALTPDDHFRPPAGDCRLVVAPEVIVCALPDEDGLIGLDRETGRPLWRYDLAALRVAAGVPGASISGPGEAVGGVVALTLLDPAPLHEVHVLGISPATGAIRWMVFLANRSGGLPPQPALIGSSRRLFALSGLGAIAAIDPFGEILWLRRYRSLNDIESGKLKRAIRRRRRTNAPLSSLVKAGSTLWAGPSDAQGYFAWDARTGEPRGGHPTGPGRVLKRGEIIGATSRGGAVVLAKDGALSVLTLTGSRRVTQFREVALQARARVHGEHAYLPCNAGVVRVDLSTGDAKTHISWRPGDRAAIGNLTLAEGRLVVASPTGLDAHGAPVPARRPLDRLRLVAALSDPCYARRAAAEEAILARAGKRPSLLAGLRKPAHPEGRMRLVRIERAIANRELRSRLQPLMVAHWRRRVPDLLIRITHYNPGIRQKVIQEIAEEITDPRVVRIIHPLLEDAHVGVSLTAATSLVKLGDGRGLSRLEGALRTGTISQKLAAVRALASRKTAVRVRPASSRQFLPASVGPQQPEPDAEAKLLGLVIDDPNPDVRKAAVRAMVELGAYDKLATLEISRLRLDSLDTSKLDPRKR